MFYVVSCISSRNFKVCFTFFFPVRFQGRMKLSALSPSWLTTASLTSGKILRGADKNEYFTVHFYAIFVLHSFVFGSWYFSSIVLVQSWIYAMSRCNLDENNSAVWSLVLHNLSNSNLHNKTPVCPKIWYVINCKAWLFFMTFMWLKDVQTKMLSLLLLFCCCFCYVDIMYKYKQHLCVFILFSLFSRTSLASMAGISAGILGLTALKGFIFYFIASLFMSVSYFSVHNMWWKAP